MQTTIKFSDNTTYNTSAANLSRGVLNGFSRELLTITATMTYAEAVSPLGPLMFVPSTGVIPPLLAVHVRLPEPSTLGV